MAFSFSFFLYFIDKTINRLFDKIIWKSTDEEGTNAHETTTGKTTNMILQLGVVLSEGLVKVASVSGILGVCSQFSSETERKH